MRWILGFIILIWVVELVNMFLGHRLCSWGIFPRTAAGLPGILLFPFLHCSIGDTLLNTIPFIVLGSLVILRGIQLFVGLSLFIILLSGTGVWLLGRSVYHAGAGGLIFGYFGFLVARGWYERSLTSILIALFTLLFCSGILWRLLPLSSSTSWEGHLFGLLTGVARASREKRAHPQKVGRILRRLFSTEGAN
jgi:membrane associated rhomboid family serine protease